MAEHEICFRDFSTIRPGDRAVLSRTIGEEEVRAFAELSGDFNPLHMDDAFAGRSGFPRRVVHGMLVAAYVSTMVGMQLPGPGALWSEQSFRWIAPVHSGDTIEFVLTVKHKSAGTRSLVLDLKANNQDGALVMEGTGTALLVEERSSTSGARRGVPVFPRRSAQQISR